MDHCVYLGHVLGSGEVYPEPNKILAVKSFPVPRTKKQVRVFLGLTGYYKRYIPDYASIVVPLTDLKKKLQNPDFSRPFTLQTDASERSGSCTESE